ncbi:MAG: WYL domain-containing protein [Verrucomicrobiae bacterium]|nr:WYL domain-containing protein [Verrucomicrobiae bacterium]
MNSFTRPPMERMLRIHQIIRDTDLGKRRFRNPYPNASNIAEILEVSNKTVLRDIEFMRERLDLPIEYDPVKHGFCYTEQVVSFPTIQISEGELFSLLVARKAISAYQGTSFEEPLKNAFRKLADSMPDSINIHLDDWDRSVTFHSSTVSIVKLDYFNQLAQAAIHKDQLLISYKKPNQKEPTERLIDPIQLVHVGNEWYLLAWCHKRNEFITFHLLRIQKIVKTGKKYTPHKGFSAEAYLQDSFGIYSGKDVHQITLWVHKNVADYFREKNWHSSQKNEELASGNLKVHYTLNSLEDIQRWILGWGGLVVALKPKELKEKIRNSADSILNAHTSK